MYIPGGRPKDVDDKEKWNVDFEEYVRIFSEIGRYLYCESVELLMRVFVSFSRYLVGYY